MRLLLQNVKGLTFWGHTVHINSMTYTLFFSSRLSISKSFFYVSLGNIFLLFLWRPLSYGGPWATAHFVSPPRLNPAPWCGGVRAELIYATTRIAPARTRPTRSMHLICYPVDASRFVPRDAMRPRYWPWPCVRPSVCLSGTSRCSTKTAKRRITQRKPCT